MGFWGKATSTEVLKDLKPLFLILLTRNTQEYAVRVAECVGTKVIKKKPNNNKCVEDQEEMGGNYVRVALKGRAKSNYPN